jgi:hypothetical protein
MYEMIMPSKCTTLVWLLQRLRLVHGIKGTISSNNNYYGTFQLPNEIPCILFLLVQHTIVTAIFLLQNIYREYMDYIYELLEVSINPVFICTELNIGNCIAFVISQVKII